MSKGQWVRHAIEESLLHGAKGRAPWDPLGRLTELNAPTADIKQMLAEIGAGRS